MSQLHDTSCSVVKKFFEWGFWLNIWNIFLYDIKYISNMPPVKTFYISWKMWFLTSGLRMLGTLNVIMLNRKGHLLTSLLLQPHCVYVQAILNQTFYLVDFKEQFKVFRSLVMVMSWDHGVVYLAFYFCQLYLGFKTCKTCVYLWRLSWKTKHKNSKHLLVADLIFYNNPK